VLPGRQVGGQAAVGYPGSEDCEPGVGVLQRELQLRGGGTAQDLCGSEPGTHQLVLRLDESALLQGPPRGPLLGRPGGGGHPRLAQHRDEQRGERWTKIVSIWIQSGSEAAGPTLRACTPEG
jgi:hypothetical protein